METRSITRDIPIDRLVVDPALAGLFIAEPETISRIARSIRANGYDPNRPIDVWKDGASRGRHVVVEGHQRLEAARAAGQQEIRVAFRHFDDSSQALLWAAEQQANRRNASKEAQCLSILRALQAAGEMDTTAELAERFGFSTATIDRARQVLARGTDSEVMAVMEGQHGLRHAYDLIRQREKRESEPAPVEPAAEPAAAVDRATESDDDLDDVPEGPVMPELVALREALSTINEAVDQAQDLFESDQRHVLGATYDHRLDLFNDITAAGNAMVDAANRFEKAIKESA